MSGKPLVSIIIPVYNGSNYMREAIDSALAQTYETLEILVINDGSTDDTEKIALSYGDRIRYFRKENGGVSTALNLGIREMRGEYFSWLSHDDAYYPNKITVQVQALEDRPDQKIMVLCKSEFMDKDSKVIPKKSGKSSSNRVTALSWKEGLHALLQNGTFNGCSLLIPRMAFDECGLFDESLRFNQDGFMWAKIFLGGYAMLSIPEVCVRSRIHKGQVTQKRQDLFHKDCETMSLFLLPELLKLTTKEDRFLFEYAGYNAKYHNDGVVKKAFAQAGKGQLTVSEKTTVRLYSLYGKVRPALRKAYHFFLEN